MKQLIAYLFLGWTMAPLIQFVEKYVFNDWEFLKFLFVITIVDTALGIVKSVKLKELSSRGFSMVFNKLIIYSCALIATHVLVHFSVKHVTSAVFSWFDTVVFSAIVVREAISIFENIALIQPDLLPSSILKYLKQFDSFTGKNKTDENTSSIN